jgi:hypothetical protein
VTRQKAIGSYIGTRRTGYRFDIHPQCGLWISTLSRHPADVDVTVMSGTFGIGVGDKFDKSDGKLVEPGGFFLEPTGMHHYAWTEGTTVIQLHGEGPLVINYVNPSDDPSTTH